jgi:polar amino acid transport system substrate-binding protein
LRRSPAAPPRAALVLPILLLAAAPILAQARMIVMTSDDSPPYAIASAAPGEPAGFMIDVAKAVFEKEGYGLRVEFFPYMRSIQEVREGRADGVLLVAEATAPGLIFLKNPISREKVAFFVKAGSPWRYGGVGSLEGKRIATGFGFDFADPEIGEFVKRASADTPALVQLISGADVNSRNFQKLLSGRVDIVIATEMIGTYVARQDGIFDRVEIAGRSKADIVAQTGFDPRDPSASAYAEMLSRGVAELLKSGRMAEIKARYGL